MCDTFINVKKRESALTFSAKDETVNCLLALSWAWVPVREGPRRTPRAWLPPTTAPGAVGQARWALAREAGFNEPPARGISHRLGAAGRWEGERREVRGKGGGGS